MAVFFGTEGDWGRSPEGTPTMRHHETYLALIGVAAKKTIQRMALTYDLHLKAFNSNTRNFKAGCCSGTRNRNNEGQSESPSWLLADNKADSAKLLLNSGARGYTQHKRSCH